MCTSPFIPSQRLSNEEFASEESVAGGRRGVSSLGGTRSRFRILLRVAILVTGLFPVAVALGDGSEGDGADDLWRHRHLGQAYYETPGQASRAVEELRAVLALDGASAVDRYNLGIALLASGFEDDGVDELELAQQSEPSLPHTWYRLGLAYESKGRFDDAIDQFSELLSRRRDEPAAHLRLGLLRQIKGELDKARDHLEAAALLDPLWAAPHFHLAGLHQEAGRSLEAQDEMDIFRALEERRRGAKVDGDPLDHPLAAFYEVPEARESIIDVDFGAPRYVPQTVLRDLPEVLTQLRLMDVDGDGGSDLWVISPYRVQLLIDGVNPRATALDERRGLVDLSVGDFDGDGLLDLCTVSRSGTLGSSSAILWHNVGGDFVALETPLPGGAFEQSVWLDYDHDGYLDLFLLGRDSILVRNLGNGTFVDRTAGFPFVQGWVHSAAALERPFDGPGRDLVVVFRERRGVLYRDRMGGDFEPRALLNVPLALGSLAVGDLDGDGYADLAGGNPSMAAVFLNDRQAGFRRVATPPGSSGPVHVVDLAGRSVLDLVAGGLVFPNQGLGRVAGGQALDGWPRLMEDVVSADFDADGQMDVAAVGEGGRLILLRGTPPSQPEIESETGLEMPARRHLRVQLTARSPLHGTLVEVKVGPSYQQHAYRGAPIDIAWRGAERADVVRIRWPNGSVHYEVDVPSGTVLRLKGPSVEPAPPPPDLLASPQPSGVLEGDASSADEEPSVDGVLPEGPPSVDPGSPEGEEVEDPPEPSDSRAGLEQRTDQKL